MSENNSKRVLKAELYLTRLRVHGFKSLKDVVVELGNRRPLVLVGANGSGKTNFIELFLFLRRALYDELRRKPYAPHAEWGNPRNLTWEASGSPIMITLEFNLTVKYKKLHYKDTVIYKVIFAPDEAFTVIRPVVEEILLKKLDYVLRRTENRLEARFKVKGNLQDIRQDLSECIRDNANVHCDNGVCYVVKEIKSDKDDVPPVLAVPSMVLPAPGCRGKIRADDVIFANCCTAIIPYPANKYNFSVGLVLTLLRSWFSKIIVLRQVDYGTTKWPHNRFSDNVLKPRAENLAEVLYRILQTREGRGRIEAALSTLFPWLEVRIEFNEYGQIGLIFYEKKGDRRIQLYPSMIPDGAVKMLAIIAAVSMKPSLLAIDEIENSLHAAILEYIFSELEDMDDPAIIATHSPIVVDLAGPERTLLLRRDTDGSTKVEKLTSRELWYKMKEEGITLGDYYIYASR